MKIHKDIKPEFVKKFKCVGPECLISCCQGWNIHIDKKTHERYLVSDNSEIKAIARDNIILNKEDKSYYSKIKFDAQGNCPFLDGKKLCMIHREMGEKALSQTCITYPRFEQHYANETRYSLTLSCPEVVRLVLFDENSMLLHENDLLLAQARNNIDNQGKCIDQVNHLIHLFSWNIIQSPSRNIEENLTALACFILYLQRIEFDLHNKLAEAEDYFNVLMAELQAGSQLVQLDQSSESVALKVRALSIFSAVAAKTPLRDGSLLDEEHCQITAFLSSAEQENIAVLRDKFIQINAQWQNVCSTSCLSKPHVLRNYFLYQLYNSYFPGSSTDTIFRQFFRIVLDYFYVKHIISIQSLTKEVDESLVMKTLAKISEKTKHSKGIDSVLGKSVDLINCGDDLSCLLLIS